MLALALVFLSFAAPLRAETPPADLARARELFQRGAALAADDKFEEAVLAFRESIAIHPAPTSSYNLAAALYELGRFAEAHAALDGLVWPKGTLLEARTRAEALSRNIDEKIARLSVSVQGGDASITLSFDGAPFGPRDTKHVVQPGQHLLRVQRGDKFLLTRPLELAPRTDTVVDVCLLPEDHFLAAPTRPPEPAPRAPSVWRSWQLWTTVGAVAVVGGVAVAAVIATRSDGGGGGGGSDNAFATPLRW